MDDLLRLDTKNISDIKEFTFDGRTFIGRVVDIIDGDTIIVIMKTDGSFYKFHVRLNGIDVCELRGDQQQRSKMIREKVLRFLLADSQNADVVHNIVQERSAIRKALL
jgi:endonuclease YncB( thermonuclease family)